MTQEGVRTSIVYEDGVVDCRAVVEVVDRIGDRWTMMILALLRSGPMRFNAILRSIDGVSHRMLTRSLRNLECDGMLRRIAYPTVPPKVEYELTGLGRSLLTPLMTLTSWVRQNHSTIECARKAFEADGGAMTDVFKPRRRSTKGMTSMA